ncbi:hypothetical protein PILCRDRAFT_5365 [Piloderma croceum F 1598]|uniref:AMP-dependent synthetase/ligase domain-containing protein n=1 Tax=Piloderma croceum (strain F 1598) TaxID=765440 RepID=A0A0C3BHD4_PILCF|nr:hypothetical protein PILCRDRAFT_5365 [Piloderma croceum F 1598]
MSWPFSFLRQSCCRVPPVSRPAGRFLSLSSVEGPSHIPLVNATLSEYFSRQVLEKHSARPALICRNESPRSHGGPLSHNLGVRTHLAWDFEEFDVHIKALTRGLLNMGVKKGDRVGVIMGNVSAYGSLQWACSSIGAILVTINPAYRLHEFVNTLNLVGVSHLFMVPEIRTSCYTSLFADAFPALRESSQGNIQEPALPALRSMVVVNNTPDLTKFQNDLHGLKCAIDWREIMVWREDTKEKKLLEEISASLDKDDIISLQFTSGTTGSPKAVSLTHSNLLNNALSIAQCMRLTPEDVLCNAPPLFHWNLAAWSQGSCVVYSSEMFDAAAVVDAVVDEKCSVLHGVPTHFLSILTEVEKREQAGKQLDFSSLRTGMAGASPVPIELMKKLIGKLNLAELTVAYGMTETSPISFQTSPDDSLLHRTETVGRVLPHVKAKLIDPMGNTVPVGTPGEVCVSGYLLQQGYWKDEKQTRAAMRRHPGDEVNLWMHTGDKGIMDKDGHLKIVGRIKDIIIRGGENLFPVQIEDVIARHPAILEAAAVAVPDEQFGEVVGAWVVRQPNGHITSEEVRRSVGENINPQNAPTWVWFAGENGTPEVLPKTASGKVMKHLLREWGRELADKRVGRIVSA